MKKHKPVIKGLCPICYKPLDRPLDKHMNIEFCDRCGYKKEVE